MHATAQTHITSHGGERYLQPTGARLYLPFGKTISDKNREEKDISSTGAEISVLFKTGNSKVCTGTGDRQLELIIPALGFSGRDKKF